MDLTSLSDTEKMVVTGAVSTLVALLTGRTLRRLLLLPFKLLSEHTKTQEDDLIVQEAARDLGLPPDAAPDDSIKK